MASIWKSAGLLTAAQIESLKQRAAGRVDRARQSIAGGSQVPEAGQSMLLATLERLDGSGRVAKLLGVTVAVRDGDHDARVLEGRYELIRKLGQGGLGRVWLARDVNLNRHVALKEISHPTGVSEAMIERFRHEAEITGRLDHPSIVPIYQLGKDEASGRMFYAMRFLGRTTLQDSTNEYHERRLEGDEDPMLLRHLLTRVCERVPRDRPRPLAQSNSPRLEAGERGDRQLRAGDCDRLGPGEGDRRNVGREPDGFRVDRQHRPDKRPARCWERRCTWRRSKRRGDSTNSIRGRTSMASARYCLRS